MVEDTKSHLEGTQRTAMEVEEGQSREKKKKKKKEPKKSKFSPLSFPNFFSFERISRQFKLLPTFIPRNLPPGSWVLWRIREIYMYFS